MKALGQYDFCMTKVRRANIDDIPALCGLLKELFTQEVEFAFDEKGQEAGLRQILEDQSKGCILILVVDQQVLGMVNLLFTVSTALGDKVIILEDLIIDSRYRKQGLGSKLLNEATTYARRAGFKRMTLLTDGINKEAQQFYEKHGFQLSSMVPMRLML